MVQFIKKESKLHYNLLETKLGVCHGGADALAYKFATLGVDYVCDEYARHL